MSTTTAPPAPADSTPYVLYGTKGSGSAIAEIGLTWCGQPYRVVHASSWEDDSDREALRQLNPLMQIPTLHTPQGEVLTESAAILMHLGLRFPAAGLLGRSEAQRDQILRGLVFIAANCYSQVTISDYPERFTTSEQQAEREAVRQGARHRLHLHWEMFADQFPGRPWLSGEAPGALDVMAVIVSKWSGTRPHLEQHRPEFLALLKRIEALPLVAGVHARHWP
ncbi:GST-like protein [Roseateles sp. YR242]|uniref:glutathione S-transferase family protein n=1 Tax=Roseateles sp. YR242 TaxID=1855305 RepID=UPI0008B55C0B|nr:glutathione S-transferase family protein [Roseateles sp. YR242]SEL30482.1 GST-like protein [Roseateles sp. YR242]